LALTVAATDNTKTYDGTTNALAAPAVAGTLETGDTGYFFEAYTNRNIGSGMMLYPFGSITNSGVDVTFRYGINWVTTNTGVITAMALTVTAASDSKEYDGTVSSTGMPTVTSGAIQTGDSPAWNQTFDSPAIGLRTLTPAGVVTDGNGGNNYSYLYLPASGSIYPAPVTVIKFR
jgi:hypothetical protein